MATPTVRALLSHSRESRDPTERASGDFRSLDGVVRLNRRVPPWSVPSPPNAITALGRVSLGHHARYGLLRLSRHFSRSPKSRVHSGEVGTYLFGARTARLSTKMLSDEIGDSQRKN